MYVSVLILRSGGRFLLPPSFDLCYTAEGSGPTYPNRVSPPLGEAETLLLVGPTAALSPCIFSIYLYISSL